MRKSSTNKARATRRLRSKTLAQVEEGSLAFSELLAAPPKALRGADIWDVLLKLPNLWRSGARAVCEQADVWPHTKVGDLTEGMKQRLLDALPPRAR